MIYNESIYNQNWDTKKLSQLGEFTRGKSRHRPRNDPLLYEGGGYPFVQTGEIKDANLYITHHTLEYGEMGLRQSKIWDAETLCITIAANIAETALLAYPMCFPDSVVGFRAYEGVSSEKFMYYIFCYIRNAIQNAASGSTQDNINIEYLTSLDFKIPQKKIQDEIVKILSDIDEKILLNQKINDNLQRQLKTLYDYWFTQFDFPDESGRPYRSSGGKMVYDPALRREIPAGWDVVSMGDILQKTTDIIESEENVPMIDLSIMPSGSIVLDKINNSDMFSTDLLVMKKGDILFGAIRPYLKKAGIAPIDGAVTGTVYAYRVKKESDYNFALFTLCRDSFFDYANRVATGTRMPVIRNDEIMTYKVPYSEKVVEKFNQLKICDMICTNVAESQKLTKLRDWLLPLLMNGQANVAD